jgi:hypothetical protein
MKISYSIDAEHNVLTIRQNNESLVTSFIKTITV